MSLIINITNYFYTQLFNYLKDYKINEIIIKNKIYINSKFTCNVSNTKNVLPYIIP
jgi:hypothetical protein